MLQLPQRLMLRVFMTSQELWSVLFYSKGAFSLLKLYIKNYYCLWLLEAMQWYIQKTFILFFCCFSDIQTCSCNITFKVHKYNLSFLLLIIKSGAVTSPLTVVYWLSQVCTVSHHTSDAAAWYRGLKNPSQ